jgi:hypothetical protein
VRGWGPVGVGVRWGGGCLRLGAAGLNLGEQQHRSLCGLPGARRAVPAAVQSALPGPRRAAGIRIALLIFTCIGWRLPLPAQMPVQAAKVAMLVAFGARPYADSVVRRLGGRGRGGGEWSPAEAPGAGAGPAPQAVRAPGPLGRPAAPAAHAPLTSGPPHPLPNHPPPHPTQTQLLSSPAMQATFLRIHRGLALLGTPLMPLMPASTIIPGSEGATGGAALAAAARRGQRGGRRVHVCASSPLSLPAPPPAQTPTPSASPSCC